MHAVAISVPGHRGRHCEDASGVHSSGDTIVVADGLGSAARGREAAQAAVHLVLGPLRRALRAGLSPVHAPAFIHWLWRESPGDDAELKTTLLFAVRTPYYTVVGRVVDGLVLCPQRPDLLPSGRGSFGNSTDALPNQLVSVAVVPNDCTLLLASDGVSDDLKPGSEDALCSKLSELLATRGTADTTEQLSAWLTNWITPNSHDDRSLALLLGDTP